MSIEDYDGWQETAHLVRAPANARRLLDAVDAFARAESETHELDRD